MWIRSLQGMLVDADEERFPRKWVTGTYDQRTAGRIIEYQETSAVRSTRASSTTPPGGC